jgi:predicted nucleic acid-binding protein
MSFVVVYDASVLHPSTVRDLLIRLAQAGLVQAKWTEAILDETFQSILRRRPELDHERLDRTRKLMCAAVRDCLITGYEPLELAVELPDADDRHVLAAAIKARAQVIVTSNLKDFPKSALAAWNIEAKSPDDFVVDQFHLDGPAVHGAVQRVADGWTNPPGSVNDVLDRLERDGLVEAAALLRR